MSCGCAIRPTAGAVHLRLTTGGVRLRQASSVLVPHAWGARGRLEGADRDAAIHGLALLARAAQQQMEAQSDAGQAEAAASGGVR